MHNRFFHLSLRKNIIALLVTSTAVLMSEGALALQFQVTRFDDPAFGTCLPGDCSLRAAALAANANPGIDTVNIPAGNYQLQIAGFGEDAGLTGDIDITEDLSLVGAGSGLTIIDSMGVDRVFDITAGAKVDITGMAINNLAQAANTHGGGIRSGGFGAGDVTQTSLILNDFALDNTRGGLEQGIDARGTLTANNVSLTHSPFEGVLALKFSGSNLILQNSQLLGNAEAMNIALSNGGTAQIRNTQLINGGAENNCGALSISGPGTAVLDRISQSGFFSIGLGVVCVGFGATVTISNSSFNNNSSAALDIGTYGTLATVNVINSTFSGNLFPLSVHSNGTLNLTNTTLVAGAEAGGFVLQTEGSQVKLTNSIVAGACSGPVDNTSIHNIESPGDSCGFTNFGPAGNQVNVSEQQLALGSLSNNGGPTLTHLPTNGSVAINAITGLGANFCPLLDQRGYLRISPCDIGAVEADGIDDVIFRDDFE